MADVHELDLFSAKVTVLFVDATWRRGGQRTPSCAIFSSTLGLGTGVDRSISLFSGPQVLRHEITGSDWKAIEASRGFTSLALSRLLMQCVCGQKKLRFRPSTANRTSAMKSSENRTAAHDVCTRLRNPVVRVLFACSHFRVAVWNNWLFNYLAFVYTSYNSVFSWQSDFSLASNYLFYIDSSFYNPKFLFSRSSSDD